MVGKATKRKSFGGTDEGGRTNRSPTGKVTAFLVVEGKGG